MSEPERADLARQLRTAMHLMADYAAWMQQVLAQLPPPMQWTKSLDDALTAAREHYLPIIEKAGQLAMLEHEAEAGGMANERFVHRHDLADSAAEAMMKQIAALRAVIEELESAQEALNQRIGGRMQRSMLTDFLHDCREEAATVRAQIDEARQKIDRAAAIASPADQPRIEAARARLARMERHLFSMDGRVDWVRHDLELAGQDAIRTRAPLLDTADADSMTPSLYPAELLALLSRLPLVMSGEVPLTLRCDTMLAGDVLSCALLASGPVETDRATQVWYSANIDLTTGDAIPLSALFAVEEEDALEAIGEWLDFVIAPEMSAHLMNSELLPIPQVYSLTPQGITFRYPIAQLSTLSDQAGTVTLHWFELPELFDFSEGSILDRIGAAEYVVSGEHTADAIRACVEAGNLPGIPAVIGQPLSEYVEAYHLLTDPDLYEGGRMFSLEDSRFRSCWLLTDALSYKSFEESLVQGIRSDCISLFGLTTAADEQPGTPIETWRTLLGDPDTTLSVDADLADLYRITPGTSDYYHFGEYTLRLHADEDGRLSTVYITY